MSTARMIDAHCHLDFAVFDDDRDEVLARARAAGVEQFVVAGTTRSRWHGLLALASRSDCYPCLGLHPLFLGDHVLDDHVLDDHVLGEHDVQYNRLEGQGGERRSDDLAELARTLKDHSEVVALGECGIDARFSDSLPRQWTLFDAQLRLAQEHDLPVVVHCVRANDDVARRLRQLGPAKGGLIHAFSGSAQQALRFDELGYVLGLGGAVTYPRAARLRRAVTSLPDHAYVLESDSPDMPLAGYQGQRNEPARVAEVCRVVAELRGQSCDEVAENSSANARRLFGLP
ncbi:TatD family hydrolase [Halomonas cupida]|uniref:TatD family hydrolase n=1 Tax=Halomonas cupida TaxID=44933 RepID=UPI003A8ED9EE